MKNNYIFQRICSIGGILGIILIILSGCGMQGDDVMFRANLQRTGVYNTNEVSELTEILWTFKTSDWVSSSPSIADGKMEI